MGTVRHRPRDGVDDEWRREAEDHRHVANVHVDVFVAIDIHERCAVATGRKRRWV
jgi:hypothetical protein